MAIVSRSSLRAFLGRFGWDTTAILIVLLAITLVLWYLASESLNKEFQNAFRMQVQDADGVLQQGMQNYIETVRTSAGLFIASEDVSRKEWHLFIESVDLPHNYPGISRMGFIRAVSNSERTAFIERVRTELRSISSGTPFFDIRPVGNRDKYMVVEYCEPQKSGDVEIGRDISVEPTWNEVTDLARDSGCVALTNPLNHPSSVNDTEIAILVPLYRYGSICTTTEQRRAAFLGFTFAVVHMGQIIGHLIERIASEPFELEIYSMPEGRSATDSCLTIGNESTASHLLYDLNYDQHPGPHATDAKFHSDMINREAIEIANRRWQCYFALRPDFHGRLPTNLPLIILSKGLLMAIILLFLGLGLANARSRVIDLSSDLQTSEAQNRAVVDHLVEGILVIDKNGILVSSNPAAKRLFGGTLEGRSIFNLVTGFSPLMIDGLVGTSVESSEAIGNRLDGSSFPLEASLGEVNMPDKRMFTAIVRDITERKRFEKDLLDAKEAAEASNRTKSRFLANISHELRTPLNSIIGFSNLLVKNKDGRLAAKDLTYIERINENGHHLLSIISEILDLSKIEAGKLQIIPEPIDLTKVIGETVELMLPQLHEKGLELITDLPASVKPLSTDRLRFKQVLLNLLGNAIKFTERGSLTIRLSIDPGTSLPLSVSFIDTGIGIPSDKLELIFEAFQQVDTAATRNFEGTGLGLTITRSMLWLMGYSIDVKSIEGQGSTFTVIFTKSISAGNVAPSAITKATALADDKSPSKLEIT
ncbi:MAG: CHASE domain-containing protein [Candidatus Riflebacteria bacterium]|nr:CHASE domain-containing protein [Candidatus Riflebacteria bacterium]